MDQLGPTTEVDIKVRTIILYPVSTRQKNKWHPSKIFFYFYLYRLDLR